jgi:hypothetical protein
MDESYSNCYQKFTRALAIRAKWGHFIGDIVESVFVNQTSKTVEINESEAGYHESENLRFVEFVIQFVREIRKIRLQISPVPTTMPLPPEAIYSTKEELYASIQAWAAHHHYTFRIGWSTKIHNTVRSRIQYNCDGCGPPPPLNHPDNSLQARKRQAPTRKIGCSSQ